jgi:hypothetical protein
MLGVFLFFLTFEIGYNNIKKYLCSINIHTMRIAEVRITEMNVGETKTFSIEFSSAPDLIVKIDNAINGAKWEKEGSLNLEVVVVDEEQFHDEEYEMLEDENIILGY